jgi:hypothetical protein
VNLYDILYYTTDYIIIKVRFTKYKVFYNPSYKPLLFITLIYIIVVLLFILTLYELRL